MTHEAPEHGRPDEDGAETPDGYELQENSFRLFVASVQDYAIFMLDPGGHIVSWNAGAERIKRYKASEIIGKHFSIFYTEYDRKRGHPDEELVIARREGRYEEEGWRIRQDGTRFWANVVITAVRDEQGRLIGFGKVTRDLTERKQQEERDRELMRERAARAEAEAANRAKSQFLATMSHELRTPLNAITGYVDLLEADVHGPLTEDQRASLKRIRVSSQLLLSLINDVLNFARLEAGRVEMQARDVPIAELLPAVESLVRQQFEEKGVAFEREDCDPELTAWTDPERAKQVLLNLLTNARKFTESGGRVWIECGADAESVRIHVRDTGRGIPEDRRERIFEPFTQIDRQRVQKSVKGVGLGLSISRDLARALGGDLTVASEAGKGSTFTLTLPRSARPLGGRDGVVDRRSGESARDQGEMRKEPDEPE